MGRKLTRPRPRQGARLAVLRREAGLSQADLARLIGETQQNVAYWELSTRPPRSDVLPKLAAILGVSIEHLIDPSLQAPPRKNGPVGKVRRTFEEVSRLPRREREKILDVVDAMLEQYRHRKAG